MAFLSAGRVRGLFILNRAGSSVIINASNAGFLIIRTWNASRLNNVFFSFVTSLVCFLIKDYRPVVSLNFLLQCLFTCHTSPLKLFASAR